MRMIKAHGYQRLIQVLWGFVAIILGGIGLGTSILAIFGLRIGLDLQEEKCLGWLFLYKDTLINSDYLIIDAEMTAAGAYLVPFPQKTIIHESLPKNFSKIMTTLNLTNSIGSENFTNQINHNKEHYRYVNKEMGFEFAGNRGEERPFEVKEIYNQNDFHKTLRSKAGKGIGVSDHISASGVIAQCLNNGLYALELTQKHSVFKVGTVLVKDIVAEGACIAKVRLKYTPSNSLDGLLAGKGQLKYELTQKRTSRIKVKDDLVTIYEVAQIWSCPYHAIIYLNSYPQTINLEKIFESANVRYSVSEGGADKNEYDNTKCQLMHSKKQSHSYHRLRPLILKPGISYEITLKPNELFVLGASPYSLDSRIIGGISRSEVRLRRVILGLGDKL